jgi:hypothetical protein
MGYREFYLTLEGIGSDECYKAFDVCPRTVFGKTDVKLIVIAAKDLDYDEGSCNDIIVKVRRSRNLFVVFLGCVTEPRRKLTEYTELPRRN